MKNFKRFLKRIVACPVFLASTSLICTSALLEICVWTIFKHSEELEDLPLTGRVVDFLGEKNYSDELQEWCNE